MVAAMAPRTVRPEQDAQPRHQMMTRSRPPRPESPERWQKALARPMC